MRLLIIGQDTLARATAECCSKHFEVTGPAPDLDLLWFCYDTPIDENDKPQPDWVMNQIRSVLPMVDPKVPVLLSSQMPVGTIAALEQEYPDRYFAYQPENIRVATAVEDFTEQARVVVGRRNETKDELWKELFAPFTKNVILTSPETAEMVKHALNCWLGMNIAWINEISRLAKSVGADPRVVSQALLCERRISPKAPLRPGSPFGGGHLSRDIHVLNAVGEKLNVKTPIISSILDSNTIV